MFIVYWFIHKKTLFRSQVKFCLTGIMWSFHLVKCGTSVPQRVLFVEELSELLTEGLPDLWKLGRAYFNGALIGDVCYMSTVYMVLIYGVIMFYLLTMDDVAICNIKNNNNNLIIIYYLYSAIYSDRSIALYN